MALPLRPRFTYTDSVGSVDLTLSLPQRPWGFGSQGVGGSDVAGSGIPAAFEVRRDYLVHLTLRFDESEWAAVERLVRHLQRAGSVVFYPDTSAGDNHTMYGHSPTLTEEIRPRRTDEPSTLEIDVTVRRTTEAIYDDEYFATS